MSQVHTIYEVGVVEPLFLSPLDRALFCMWVDGVPEGEVQKMHRTFVLHEFNVAVKNPKGNPIALANADESTLLQYQLAELLLCHMIELDEDGHGYVQLATSGMHEMEATMRLIACADHYVTEKWRIFEMMKHSFLTKPYVIYSQLMMFQLPYVDMRFMVAQHYTFDDAFIRLIIGMKLGRTLRGNIEDLIRSRAPGMRLENAYRQFDNLQRLWLARLAVQDLMKEKEKAKEKKVSPCARNFFLPTISIDIFFVFIPSVHAYVRIHAYSSLFTF